MAAKNYGNLASTAATSAPVGPADLTATLSSFSGYPAAPFWAEFEKGTASAEIVLVTNVAGNVVTITRGQGGTSATSHGAGVTFEHVVPAGHFNDTETHMDATSAHGVTGNIVGTSGSQTIQDKTYRGAHRAVFSDALPAGVTASYESAADSAAARDGYLHNNTAGDVDRRGFLLRQSGTDRFQVFNDGTVDVNPGASARPGLRNRSTTQLDGAVDINAAMDITGDVTVNGSVTVTGDLGLDDITADSVSATGAIHAGGSIDTDLNLVVDGTSTLTGTVSAGGAVNVAGTATAATVASTGNITAVGSASAASVAATGAITAHGGSRTVVSASSLAGITSPVTDQIAWHTANRDLYRYDGAAWVSARTVAGRLVSTAGNVNTNVNTTEQSIDKLAIHSVRIEADTWYVFNVKIRAGFTQDGDAFVVRVREGTALTGTIVADWSWNSQGTGDVHDETFTLPWKAPADDTTSDFFVSIVRAFGTGVANVAGDRRTAFWIDDRGADSVVWREVA